MKRQVIVGLNTGHDGGAAIIVDGKILCAISEERLNRRRYSHGYLQSFFYCLRAANLEIKDVDLIVFSSYGKNLPKGYQGDLKGLGIKENKFISVDHHLSHALCSYFLSPFREALVIVVDGEGNNNATESYYVGEGDNLQWIGGNDKKRIAAKGIGRTYEAFTNFLGWTDQDAGKTMGLSSYADAPLTKEPLFIIRGDQVGSRLTEKYDIGAIKFIKDKRLPFGEPYSKGTTKKGIMAAAYVQRETEIIMLELVKRLVKKTGKRRLCLSGGVGLNSSLNAKLIKEGVVDDIFIFPAASDRGQPIGNALFGYRFLNGSLSGFSMSNDYFGRVYAEDEITAALNRNHEAHVRKVIPTKKLYFEKQKNIAKVVAGLIKDGKIIGWFQGGSELGPRALGHRSIICDPRKASMKNVLNSRIKHRENFRPFAPSCLAEYSADFFDWVLPSEYMLFVVPIKDKYSIPAVRHVDGTGRLQTVTKESNGIWYDLIKEFYNLTKTPIILNTSFNDNEPIVETPGDAVTTFLSTDLDFLAIGDYLVYK